MKKIAALCALALLYSSCGNVGNLPSEKGKTAIVAHRGFWCCEAALNSQNSLASLREAQENGFWGSECDIHLTADGKIIVNHDHEIDGIRIVDGTFSELSSHLLPNGEERPSFDEYLAQAALSKTVLVVEFKTQYTPEREDLLVDGAFERLKAHGLFDPSRVAFISFSHHICRKIAAEAPEFTNQYLTGDIDPLSLHKEGINGIDYEQGVFVSHPEWVKQAHDCGMSVNVWTVDDADRMKWMLDLGVDQITTNAPLLLRSLSGRKEYR